MALALAYGALRQAAGTGHPAGELFRRAGRQPRHRRAGCRSPGCISTWCAGAADLDAVLEAARPERWLSLGLVDGRNVWRTDLRAALGDAADARPRGGGIGS